MWPPLSRMLDWIGRFRLWPFGGYRTAVSIGRLDSADSLGTMDWRNYLDAERLYNVWGPSPAGPWTPFHCVTLFAAADPVRSVFGKPSALCPVAPDPVGAHLAPDTAPPPWLTPRTWTIIDLPGPLAVATGVYLLGSAGCQPVCTFDNWPNPQGVLRAEVTLAALLYYASRMAALRERVTASAPPVWLCDRDRFAASKPGPGKFDNRYFLDDRLIPGVGLLRSAGIERIVYVSPLPGAPITADLGRHLSDLSRQGFELLEASVGSAEELASARPLDPGPKARFNAAALAFMRSSAGGFGRFVPQPSSGSGG